MIPLISALLSGLCFYLSMGLDNVWWLAWFAPAPLLWLAYGKAPLWQVILAATFAILCGQIYALQCYAMLPPMLILIVIGPTVLLFDAAVVMARWIRRKAGPWLTLLAFPLAWTAAEYLFELISPNGTYGAFAYSQISMPILIQGASLFGLAVVTFLICLVANTIAMAVHSDLRRAPVLALGFSVAVLNLVFGWVRLSSKSGELVTVGALGDDALAGVAFADSAEVNSVTVAQAYADAVRTAATKGARLIVTPEGGIGVTPSNRQIVLKPLADVAQERSVEIVVGLYDRQQPGDLAVLIRPNGTQLQYDKRHLVPFLETAFKPGRGSGWIGGGEAMEICKDMDFPSTIRADAARGVRLVAVPAGDFTKDAWLHARISFLRGVENGFAMVRSAHQGFLSVVDAQGRIVSQRKTTSTGMNELVATVPLGPGPTLYTRIGDLFAWFATAATLVIALIATRKSSDQRI